MAKYYFTYGFDDGGGWTEVTADDLMMAIDAFKIYHPLRDGMIPCCSWYPAEEFEKTRMFRDGNLGQRCKESIVLNHFDYLRADV